jgi:hypothetical protein
MIAQESMCINTRCKRKGEKLVVGVMPKLCLASVLFQSSPELNNALSDCAQLHLT